MDLVERAERKSRMLAITMGVMGVVVVVLLSITMWTHVDGWRGFQAGLTAAALFYLTPFVRWLLPNKNLARLIDDERTQAHRGTSCTIGLVAAVVAAFATMAMTEGNTLLTASDAARMIMSVGVAAALLSFAALELRAAR